MAWRKYPITLSRNQSASIARRISQRRGSSGAACFISALRHQHAAAAIGMLHRLHQWRACAYNDINGAAYRQHWLCAQSQRKLPKSTAGAGHGAAAAAKSINAARISAILSAIISINEEKRTQKISRTLPTNARMKEIVRIGIGRHRRGAAAHLHACGTASYG